MTQQRLYIGFAFFSSWFWICSSGYLAEVSTTYSILLGLLAATCFLVAEYSKATEDQTAMEFHAAYYLAVAGLALAMACVWGFPFSTPFIAIFVSCLILLIFKKARRTRRVGQSVLRLGLCALFQVILLDFLLALDARVHGIEGIGLALHGMLTLLGEETGFRDGIVSVQTDQGIVGINPSVELALFVFAVLFLFAIGLARSFPISALGKFVLVVSGYSAVRALFVVLLSMEFMGSTPVFSLAFGFATTIPLALLCLFVNTEKSVGVESKPSLGPSTTKQNTLIAIACGCVLGLMLVPMETGSRKEGRKLVINEFHSDWEQTDDEYDTAWFGRRSGYNYNSLKHFLSNYFEIEVNRSEVSQDTLSNTDFLLLKTPTEPYSSGEIEAMHDFVRNGGSIVLLGDHTNVFGVGTHFNQLIDEFGIQFNYDSQHGLTNGGLTLHEHAAPIDHMSMNQVRSFLFGTGCTLQPDFRATDLLVGRSNMTKRADYSVSNFFLRQPIQLQCNFGAVSQIAGAQYGRGRVVVFSDSTVFSNFWMFVPGKPELMLAMLDWSSFNNLSWLGFVPRNILVLGLLGLCLMFAVVLRCESPTELVGCLLPLLVVSGISIFSNQVRYGLDPRSEIPYVNYFTKHSDYFLPRTSLIPERNEKGQPTPNYGTLFTIPSRLQQVPRETDSLSEVCKSVNNPCFIVEPASEFSASENKALMNWVSRGGQLVVFVSNNRSKDALEETLKAFDLEIGEPVFDAEFASPKVGDAKLSFIRRPPFQIKGGKSIFKEDSADATVCAFKALGKGNVIVVGFGASLENGAIGDVSAVPTSEQLQLYVFMFELLEATKSKKTPFDSVTFSSVSEFYGQEDVLSTVK